KSGLGVIEKLRSKLFIGNQTSYEHLYNALRQRSPPFRPVPCKPRTNDKEALLKGYARVGMRRMYRSGQVVSLPAAEGRKSLATAVRAVAQTLNQATFPSSLRRGGRYINKISRSSFVERTGW